MTGPSRVADSLGPHTASAPERPLLAGVDIGGSKIAVLLVDRDEHVVARRVVPTLAGAPDQAVNEIAAVVRDALSDAGCSVADLAALGVGVPGRVDPSDGTVTLAVNLGWLDLPLGRQLAAEFGRPCVVENDVRAAALGLYHRRRAGTTPELAGVADLAYLAVGTGVSAGVVLGGQLHRGARGLAGEIGHVVVETAGIRCACGQTGCLETLVSGPAIARLARQAIESGQATMLAATSGYPTAVDVYRAASDGDTLATGIAAGVGRRLAWAVHLLVMTYDVERVVLGGGVSHAGQTFIAPIRAELDRLRASSGLARQQLAPGTEVLLEPSTEAGAWGAVTIAAAARAGFEPGQGWKEVGHVREM